MPPRMKLSGGERTPTFEEAFTLTCELSKRLIPYKTICESIGVDHDRFVAWLGNHKGKAIELGRIRGTAMIEAQDRIMRGEKGWQATARMLESIDPELWLKKSTSAFGRKTTDISPYTAGMLRK